jgi:ATP-dependent Clp protease adapter protein ClpS
MKRLMHQLPYFNSGEQTEKSPGADVLEKTEEEESVDTPWRIILYNDHIHTFDEVINQLIKALGCTVQQAEEYTIKVHEEGKANVFEGSFEECLKINSVLQEIQLITEIKG